MKILEIWIEHLFCIRCQKHTEHICTEFEDAIIQVCQICSKQTWIK